MENIEKQEKKFGLKFRLPLGAGVFAVAVGILTFVLIYNSIPNYLLLKNNYDIYNNPEKRELDPKDYAYKSSEASDASFFTINIDNFVIDFEALVNDNPSYKTGDYMIDYSFYLKCEFPNYEQYSVGGAIDISIDGVDYKWEPVTVNSTNAFYHFTFKDGAKMATFDLTRPVVTYKDVDYQIEISDIRVMFYSLKK